MNLVNSSQWFLTQPSPSPAGPSTGLGCSNTWQAETGRITQMVITVLIFLVGVSLNSLVVYALAWRGRGRLTRRGSLGQGETRGASSFRVYVVNLALADLVLLLRTPLMLAYLAHSCSWPVGKLACRLVVFLRGLGLYAAAFLLCAVAVERCLCLLRPVWSSLKRPRWAVPLVCGLLWGLAAALATPYLHTADLLELNGTTQCLESLGYSTGLFVTETVAGFLMPLTVFLVSNVAVLWTARQAGVSGPTSPSSSSSFSATARQMARLYRVLFLTMLLFLSCWVPYFTCRFLRALAAGRPDRAGLYRASFTGAYVSLFLVYLKSSLNPVLYVFAARGLGRTVRASLPSTIERVFNYDYSDSRSRRTLRREDSQI
ncbi:C5a anaphylatoxin chemotactic receptor 1-like [Oncorhynchus masou masou]|uniref:C5a anaphylatoxin chemotactic receptor 1-like n=1 Tax=Oncorhynchus masou masou TaxID=90313 RepID=UPI003182DF7A